MSTTLFRESQLSTDPQKQARILRAVPGGQLEERLREWVKVRLKRERGTASGLAKHLGRERSWVTMYSAQAVDADLDTSVQIAAFFHLSLASILGEAALVVDEENAAKIRAYDDLQALLQRVPLPRPTPRPARSDAPKSARAPAMRTTPEADRRRPSGRRKTGT